jgi:beta-galactosidase
MRILVAVATVFLAYSPAAESRQRLSFDSGWRFFLGDPAGAQAPAFDDSSWRPVTLPHDWSIEGKIDQNNPTGGSEAFLPAGIGWYRRAFIAPKEWALQRFAVEFEGVYSNAEVWLNGQPLCSHPYGYTTFICSPAPGSGVLKPGAHNVLAVRVDDSKQQSSRWYPGAGIYRHVWATVTGPASVAPWGVFVTTPEVSASRAKIVVRTETQGTGGKPIRIQTVLFGPDGRQVAVTATDGAAQEFHVASPALWSPDSPKLYRAVTRLLMDGKTADEVETPFGIRSLEWSAAKGFLLNGKPTKLAGGCIHHDDGVLGAAAFDRAEERRIELLKAAGFNAIRTAHNPPSPGLLAACDRLGMLVLDEAFDCWERAKKPYDYHLYFKDWWQRDIDAMVLRDRNHPSVAIWSIGNEIPERDQPEGAQTGKMLADYVRKLDPTRPITTAANNPQNWLAVDNLFASLDIGGYNYNLNRHVADHERVPSRVMMSTESFPRDTFSYWKLVNDFPYIVGDFVWTAMDYLGENGIGRWYAAEPNAPRQSMMGDNRLFPWHSAECGDLDVTGYRRPVSHYRNIVWGRGEKLYLAVRQPAPEGKQIVVTGWGMYPEWPSWTWPGQEGRELEVEASSNAERVRLFLNDKQIGEMPTGIDQQFKAVFKVPYSPGVLKAVALEGGRTVAETTLETVGEPVRIRLTADRKEIRADSQDLSFVTVEILDRAGRFQPNASQNLRFSIKGQGVIAGLGNADMTNDQPYKGEECKVFHGRALVVLRSSGAPGQIALTATGPGMETASIAVQTKKPVSR